MVLVRHGQLVAYLALLQPDARAAARLSTALCVNHSVSAAATWRDLNSILARGEAAGVVVDADHPDREHAVWEIKRLRRRYPEVAIVAYGEFRGEEEELYRFGGLGVDGVLPASKIGNTIAIRTAVNRAVASARASCVADLLVDAHGELGARTVAWAMEHAHENPTHSDMAAALGYTSHTLSGELRAAGLPSAGRLILWGRLLLVGAYLGVDGHTVEEAAFLVGYSTASSLSRALKRETGAPPSEVASKGGLNYVQEALFPSTPRQRHAVSKSRALLMAAVVATQSACAGLGLGGGLVDTGAVDRVLENPPVHQIHFGVLAVDASDGRVLYARNADRKFIPASNQKILVTSSAMSLLGPDYTFETAAWGAGTVRGDVLEGDLVLLSAGDPTLSERYWDSGGAAMAALADSLHRTGLRRVTGALVVDATAWDSVTVGPTWEVEDLRYRYGSTGGAFALEQGELHVVVSGGSSEGDPAQVSWHPLGTTNFVSSEILTAPADSSTRVQPSYLPESRRIVLRGRAAQGSVDTLLFALRDPVRQASAALARALLEAGITVDGGWSVAWEEGSLLGGGCRTGFLKECAEGRRLAGLTSPPLSEIVAGILEPSQNWMAEQLLHTLGAELGEAGSWAGGIDVMKGFLLGPVGLDSLDLSPRDASGLSAYNLVTPRALVTILRHMAAGPHADVYRRALAEPGEEDSTLARRLEGFEGRIFAKTGTISNVNSLSGYLVRDDGREVVFSILSNGSGLSSSQVRETIDDVVRILAR